MAVISIPSGPTGEITLNDLGPGIYGDFEIIQDLCQVSLNDSFQLGTDIIEPTVTFEDLINCEAQNGRIVIGNLDINTNLFVELYSFRERKSRKFIERWDRGYYFGKFGCRIVYQF